MACSSCAKSYSLLRKEKGCPGCGFSYCTKCLDHKMFLPKINAEAKVCKKCAFTKTTGNQKISPPDAYFKRLENTAGTSQDLKGNKLHDVKPIDKEILSRLNNLRENTPAARTSSDQEIEERLKKIKGDTKMTTDEELHARLANIKDVKPNKTQNKQIMKSQDLRSQQEQADDLMKQYMEQTKIEQGYKDEFDQQVNDMVSRLQKIKEANTNNQKSETVDKEVESEDEENTIKKIVEKISAEANLERKQEFAECYKDNDELPFCEICNEDATVRCLGCRYIFCIRCFKEHKDDDECNRFETYVPPKNT